MLYVIYHIIDHLDNLDHTPGVLSLWHVLQDPCTVQTRALRYKRYINNSSFFFLFLVFPFAWKMTSGSSARKPTEEIVGTNAVLVSHNIPLNVFYTPIYL